MYPIVLIGPVAVPTYPLLLLLALWVGMWLAARRARQLGLDGDHVYNAGLYGFLAGIIGARLWFVLTDWDIYASNSDNWTIDLWVRVTDFSTIQALLSQKESGSRTRVER